MLPEGNDRLSYRSLLYTAVTRAKKLLVLVGSPRKVHDMVQNQERTVRYSCLSDMLRRKTEPEPAAGGDTDAEQNDDVPAGSALSELL